MDMSIHCITQGVIFCRELVDWVVKKEDTLAAMGQVGGDEATIRNQQVVFLKKYCFEIWMKC